MVELEWLLSEYRIKIDIIDKIDIIKKNFGQIYLSKIRASSVLISLLIEGATKKDWNIIIPNINTDIIWGNCLIIFLFLYAIIIKCFN